MLRWALKLEEYDFSIQYIKGESNVADYLSRNINIISKGRSISSLTSKERTKALKETHDILGHGTAANMKFFWEDREKWNGFFKDVDDYVRNCQVCAQAANRQPARRLEPICTNYFGELWELDLIGRIIGQDGASKFIFVAQDNFTKWIEAKVIPDKCAKTILKCIQDLIIKKHGVPTNMYVDNGREFVNEKIKVLCKSNRINLNISSAYHHQSTGGI